MKIGKYGRNRMWPVLGFLAVVYGLGAAFGQEVFGEDRLGPWLATGAIILGLLFVAFMVVPFVLWLMRGNAPGH